MKRVVLVVFLLACQKQDDPSTIATTSTPPTAVASASATPLATIDPPVASASSAAPRDAGPSIEDKRRAALAQQAEAMQLQMLKAFASAEPMQGALNRSDLPPVDLSALAAERSDGGRHPNTDLRLGGGGGTLRAGGPGVGGLSEIGARDH